MNKYFLALVLSGFLVINPNPSHAEIKTVLLAGGCFWCLQHDMDEISGVVSTEAGYAGGDRPNATYDTYHELNSTYKVPHLEVVQVRYDTKLISHSALLSRFLRKIDPTDGGGQFCDRGPSYRPAIFIASDEEKDQATKLLKGAEKQLGKSISVDILPAAAFWRAEEYHQQYAAKNPIQYKFYRYRCGRDQRVEAIWGAKK